MINPDDMPEGYIQVDGRRYVSESLFEAANQHVIGQGLYHNGLMATMNEIAATNRKLEAERLRLAREVHTLKAELEQCQHIQAAMRTAVYGAAEGL